MIYDGLTYADQIRQLWKLHEKDAKVTEEEFLSRFRKEDKIFPVISLVFYYGLNDWDGNMDLYEMFYKGEQIQEQELMKAYIPNYPINLVDAGNLEDVRRFQTDLQVIFGMLQYKSKKEELLQYMLENRSYFNKVDIETYQAIREMLHSEKQLKGFLAEGKGDETVDMCKALDDIYEDGKSKGRSEGLREGIKVLIGTCKEFKSSKKDTIIRLCQNFLLSEEEAEEYIERFWI